LNITIGSQAKLALDAFYRDDIFANYKIWYVTPMLVWCGLVISFENLACASVKQNVLLLQTIRPQISNTWFYFNVSA